MNEERIKIKGDVELGATVAYPDKEGKRPLVVLHMGTGSLDRDGNGGGLKLNLYKDLSDYFISQGCVCVRYDKRGTHESKKGVKLSSHTLSNLVLDAKSVIDYAKELPFVDEDKVIVCGHSEGAMIATLLTEKTNVDGLILLGGAGMSLKDAMFYQNDKLLEEAENGKGFVYWLLRKTANKDKINAQVEGMFEKANRSHRTMFFYRGSVAPTKYVQEHGALTGADFVRILKNYKGRVLAITGTEDLQSNHEALQQLEGMENIELFAPEGVNHILREIDGDNSMHNIMKQYKRLSKAPLHTGTLDKIGTWLSNNFTKTQDMEK